jgi:hypothetical protein
VLGICGVSLPLYIAASIAPAITQKQAAIADIFKINGL